MKTQKQIDRQAELEAKQAANSPALTKAEVAELKRLQRPVPMTAAEKREGAKVEARLAGLTDGRTVHDIAYGATDNTPFDFDVEKAKVDARRQAIAEANGNGIAEGARVAAIENASKSTITLRATVEIPGYERTFSSAVQGVTWKTDAKIWQDRFKAVEV